MKLSKKSNERVFKAIQKINPSASKNTSFDQAYEILAKYGKLTGNISSDTNGNTKFQICNEETDAELAVLTWGPETGVFADGDWDWTTIYKDVCEYIIKNKLVKLPRASKATKAQVTDTTEVHEEEEEVEVTSEESTETTTTESAEDNSESVELEPVVNPEPEIPVEISPEEEMVQLKRKKSSMYQKLREWKMKGKDYAELKTQYNSVLNRISVLKPLCKKNK